MDSSNIKLGDYIIIQRQKYTKLFKYSSKNAITALGNDQVELKNIESQPYFTTFKMTPKTNRGKRLMTLEPSTDVQSLKETINVNVIESGVDNRHINANGESQTLKFDDIAKLRESCSSASEIVGQIVENSKTFSSKTEYAQDKYLKKKEKKYFEYLQIRRPTVRMIAEIMYRQDSEKIYGLRIDSLSQLISYSGVCGTGNYLVYESGTNGLIPAALLNSIGANNEAKLLHMHQGNIPQKQALLALNLEKEQLDRCISVNLYSVLRQYYQGNNVPIQSGKRKLDANSSDEPSAKVSKTDIDENAPKVDELKSDGPVVNKAEENTDTTAKFEEKPADPNQENKAIDTVPKWVFENERGCELLRENLDALIIVAREHPGSILKALLPFIKPSRPVVIFNTSREILMELYVELKTTGQVTGLRLTSNWLRHYQVLPNRTHPDVNMSANSGFLLCGYTIR